MERLRVVRGSSTISGPLGSVERMSTINRTIEELKQALRETAEGLQVCRERLESANSAIVTYNLDLLVGLTPKNMQQLEKWLGKIETEIRKRLNS